MEISFYPARRCREIFRKIFQVYGIEPDWEKVRNSRDTFWRIETPAVYTGGRYEELPAPRAGERTHLVVSARVNSRLEYETEKNYVGALPQIQLAEYPWEHLNTQSLDESLPLVTDMQKFTLSASSKLLEEHIPRVHEFTIRVEKRVEREGESVQRTSAMERLGPKVKTIARPDSAPEKTLSRDEYDSCY